MLALPPVQQAWADHDEDDARERQVLDQAFTAQPSESDANKDGKPGMSGASVRYQSQRSQYLRIILDAEKEIARLEGLYDALLDVEGVVGRHRQTRAGR